MWSTWRWLFKWKSVSPFTPIVLKIVFGVASARMIMHLTTIFRSLKISHSKIAYCTGQCSLSDIRNMYVEESNHISTTSTKQLATDTQAHTHTHTADTHAHADARTRLLLWIAITTSIITINQASRYPDDWYILNIDGTKTNTSLKKSCSHIMSNMNDTLTNILVSIDWYVVDRAFLKEENIVG
jgi:hypothetical protein